MMQNSLTMHEVGPLHGNVAPHHPSAPPSSHHTSPDEQLPQVLTIRMLMSGKEVGSIIGRKGENVKNYRGKSGARINISDGSCPERIVTVTGLVDQIFIAFKMMCQKFEDDFTESLTHQKERNGGEEQITCPPVTLRILVPGIQCGSIIGKGGCKIKEIREQTGASIQVASELLPNSSERSVTISGAAKAVARCIKTISEILIEAPPRGAVIPYRSRPSAPPATNQGSQVSPNIPYNSAPQSVQSSVFLLPAQELTGSNLSFNSNGTHPTLVSPLATAAPTGIALFSSHPSISMNLPLGASLFSAAPAVTPSSPFLSANYLPTMTAIPSDGTSPTAFTAPMFHSTRSALLTPTLGLSSLHSPSGTYYGNGTLDVNCGESTSTYMNGHSTSSSSLDVSGAANPSSNGSSECLSLEMVIPNELIGCIIGRGGSKINEIRQQSKAQIRISTCDQAGVDQRKITISGDIQQISAARYLISHNMELHKLLLNLSKVSNSYMPFMSCLNDLKASANTFSTSQVPLNSTSLCELPASGSTILTNCYNMNDSCNMSICWPNSLSTTSSSSNTTITNSADIFLPSAILQSDGTSMMAPTSGILSNTKENAGSVTLPYGYISNMGYPYLMNTCKQQSLSILQSGPVTDEVNPCPMSHNQKSGEASRLLKHNPFNNFASWKMMSSQFTPEGQTRLASLAATYPTKYFPY